MKPAKIFYITTAGLLIVVVGEFFEIITGPSFWYLSGVLTALWSSSLIKMVRKSK